MSKSDDALLDRALQLHGESLQAMRAEQKKWFNVVVAGLGAYAVSLGITAALTHGGGLLALFALPLLLIAFQAGRLAGRTEAVERVRAQKR